MVAMSRIITYRKCDNCGCEYDIIYKWKCKECGYVNSRIVKAWPLGDLGWIKLGELKDYSVRN